MQPPPTSPTALPPPRPPVPGNRRAPYRVGVVCLGNICRSPIAAAVLTDRVRAAGLGERVLVESAGTGDWHLGEPMDRRAAAVLSTRGCDPSDHRARQADAGWLAEQDLVLAMDATNLTDLNALGVAPDRLRMFRAFDPAGGPDQDVPDPYYGDDDGFDNVLRVVERSCETLIAELARPLAERR